jgi:hypothetical protein
MKHGIHVDKSVFWNAYAYRLLPFLAQKRKYHEDQSGAALFVCMCHK